MKDIKILIAHHKPGMVIKSGMYLPLHVGKTISKYKLDIQGDDTGDNISKLNPIFCEMTAVYWGWKNIKADYIGLCHYRRYFTFKKASFSHRLSLKLKYACIKTLGNMFRPGVNYAYNEQILALDDNNLKKYTQCFENELSNRLESNDFDFIVPEPYKFACRNNETFFSEIGRDHIQKLKDIVKFLHPDFYEYVEATLRSNTLFAANMCIFRYQLFDDYCNVVFSILKKHIENVQFDNWCTDPISEKCYARVSGYLAVILTNAYVLKMIKEKKKGLFVNVLFCKYL